MDNGKDLESGKLQSQLQSLTEEIRILAESCQGDSLLLLAVLRALESLHREIRDGLFQASLPDNRQALYKLLRNIEAHGGWPYIHRMKLRSLLECNEQLSVSEDAPAEPNSESISHTDNSPA
ncbi:MAG: hypothetical protein HC849_07170 [Oscillatoriales cyanobacterium RU_3_3]|nr:hypothetical protein [Microcoleus sp. SM1_3_4]NJM60004.1 hypothetical protein [Oscillatoriales cyanobacterium RU_3_3]NJR24376.1 hypothetical protein [Richelia sp. CSU_2_1]